ANVELSGVFQNLAQQRRRTAPVVPVLAGHDQDANLRRSSRSAWLLGIRQTSNRADQQRDHSQSSCPSCHRLTSIAKASRCAVCLTGACLSGAMKSERLSVPGRCPEPVLSSPCHLQVLQSAPV